MADSGYESELAEHFHRLSLDSLPRAPLHSAVSASISRQPEIAGLLTHAPRRQRQPVLLLAVIHGLLLADPTHPLADWYPTLTEDPRLPGDPELDEAVGSFVAERSEEIVEQLGWRRTQTNEVGRCAFLFAAMAPVGAALGPLSHVDVGTSAGLNLLLPHYAYRYDDDAPLGTGQPLLECSTRDSAHRPTATFDVAASVGLDIAPLDTTNVDDARWLKACVWPDQLDRFERLSAAIEVAQRHPPDIRTGDANDVVTSIVNTAAAAGHPVVTTSWVLNYFTSDDRVQFMSLLDALGTDRDLTWVFAESPAQTPELPHSTDVAGQHLTALTTVAWRGGVRTVTHLATCHPHGYWIRYR